MSIKLRSMLFPATIRQLPQRRAVLNVLRILHILCFSIYLGGLYFGQPSADLQIWLWGAVVSGLALLLVDLHSSCIMLFEVRGISVLIKLLLLLCLPYLDAQSQLWLVVLVVIVSAYVSHSSRRLRHRNLLPLSWQRRLRIEHLVESRGRSA